MREECMMKRYEEGRKIQKEKGGILIGKATGQGNDVTTALWEQSEEMTELTCVNNEDWQRKRDE